MRNHSDYQYLPPQQQTGTFSGASAKPSPQFPRSAKRGIKKTSKTPACSAYRQPGQEIGRPYLNQKLDEIEARIDRKTG